jgi:hypothetical protein
MKPRTSDALSSRVLRRPCLFPAALLTIAGLVSPAQAAPVNVPVTGEIERISINDPADHWSGGTIQVGGQIVILPRNLLLDLPANRLTLKQLYEQAPAACVANGETGLAKGDRCNASGAGGFATLSANQTNAGNVIAGDVLIQKGIEILSGRVSYVDYNDGYYRLNGVVGDPATGVMVRLNDPTGRHTVQQGLGCAGGPNCSPDPRFTLDPDNYTNVFASGYPVCIPSTMSRTFADILGLGVTTAQANPDGSGDVLCPGANRPAPPAPGAPITPVADSRRFAPVQVGDSVVAEGNFETINGVRFLSAHTSMVQIALATNAADPTQPDYIFLDEVEMDAPGFENERVRSLFIGYATQLPADVLIWSLHRDPLSNDAHEFPLATTRGCDIAGGVGTCTQQGLVRNGADIFKIRHDVDFLVGADGRLNPCAHLIADPRMGTGFCPGGAFSTKEMLGILSPIPHEIQARTGKKFASLQPGGVPLVSIDVSGNEATNGQYLFPFGVNLGGIAFPEMNEIDLNQMNKPFRFSGIPWNLDRRLSPGGCIDTTGPTGVPDGIPDCEATPQPLDPFPFEALDPRTQALVPSGPYNDPNFTASLLSDSRNRILSYVTQVPVLLPDGTTGFTFNFNGDASLLAWPPVDPAAMPISAVTPVILACSDTAGGNTPPVARADSASTPQDVAVVIAVLANDTDIDGNALTVTAATQPANGTVVINLDNSVTYAPNAGFSGTNSFTYTVSDGLATATGTVTVTVLPAGNVAPVAVNDVATTAEETVVTIAVLANDSDANGDALTVTGVTQGANGAVVANPDNTLSYTPNVNFNGGDSFGYTISDGKGGTASATVSVTVTPVNDAPVAADDTASVGPNSAVTIPVLANDSDPDGNPLTVAAVTQGANGAVAINPDNTVRYTPNANFSGTDGFTYTVADGAGGTAVGAVTVTVSAAAVDTIAVADAVFRVAQNEWRIAGAGSVTGNTITIHLGSTLGGPVVGTATVNAGGAWRFRERPATVPPGAETTISIESSGGGVVLGFPITIQ